jgi:hypothetical protein
LRNYWQVGLDGAKFFKSQTIIDGEDINKRITDSYGILADKLSWVNGTPEQAIALANLNLDFNLQARFDQINNKMLAYYYEAGSPVPNPFKAIWMVLEIGMVHDNGMVFTTIQIKRQNKNSIMFVSINHGLNYASTYKLEK